MKRSLAILLTFILLFSNIGLTVATHFCGGEAVKNQLMVGQKDLGCGMAEMEKRDMPEEARHYEAKGCCENQYHTLDIEDDYSSGFVKLKLKADFVIAFAYSFLNLDLFSESEHPKVANYSPPLLLRDISVLNQVFII